MLPDSPLSGSPSSRRRSFPGLVQACCSASVRQQWHINKNVFSFVYGLVVYTGHNTKIMKNSPNARHKISSVESLMNMQIIFIFVCQIVLSLIGAITCVIQINSMDKNALRYIFVKGDESFGFLYFIYRLGTWIVLLNNLVPISLLMTLELVKYFNDIFKIKLPKVENIVIVILLINEYKYKLSPL